MDLGLATLALSILSGMPAPAQGKDAGLPGGVVASWQERFIAQYPCPDPKSNLDPMGTLTVRSEQTQTCKGETCKSEGTARVGMEYPKTMLCQREALKSPTTTIFKTGEDAEEFHLACEPGKCENWNTHQASTEEITEYFLQKYDWRLDHWPGGDDYSYPDGVWQVFSKKDVQLQTPLGTGRSAAGAVANTLWANREVQNQ